MEMTVVSTGLAWAVPVRPDDLGAHLQAYKKALPVLTALQLCNRFGTGSNIAKLPPELVLAIGDKVFEAILNGSRWKEAFLHYESRCEPFIDHCEDPSVLYDCKEDFPEALCKACKVNVCADCTAGCNEKVMELMNERCVSGATYDWRFDHCQPKRDDWEEMIDQTENGKFTKYDKMLRKHFGLRAVFSTTRQAAGSDAPWTEDPNHKWHVAVELKTTICHLTLPRNASTQQTYHASIIEADLGVGLIEGTQSSYVELPSLVDKDKRSKQFHHALRSLRLEPYIHPSQLNDTITAELDEKRETMEKGSDIGQEACAGKVEAAEKVEWPKLIMLVASQAAFG